MVARSVVGLVHDQQRHFRQVNDAVGGIVPYHLRCGHENPAKMPHGLALLRGCFTGVGDDALFVHFQKLPCHANVLVHQAGGRRDQDDFLRRCAQMLRHHHPLDGGFSETGGHHHQAGAGECPLKGAELVGPCLHAIPKTGVDDGGHAIGSSSRVQKRDEDGWMKVNAPNASCGEIFEDRSAQWRTTQPPGLDRTAYIRGVSRRGAQR